jgi:ribonuclease P protein component
MPQSRVGFVVSKKVGGAVARNRAKRLMREAMRVKFLETTQGYDLVLIGRPAMPQASLHEVAAALEDVLRRAKLLK